MVPVSGLINRLIIIKINYKNDGEKLCDPSQSARVTLMASASNHRVVKVIKLEERVLGTPE